MGYEFLIGAFLGWVCCCFWDTNRLLFLDCRVVFQRVERELDLSTRPYTVLLVFSGSQFDYCPASKLYEVRSRFLTFWTTLNVTCLRMPLSNNITLGEQTNWNGNRTSFRGLKISSPTFCTINQLNLTF